MPWPGWARQDGKPGDAHARIGGRRHLASITSLGIGSGMDLNAVVSQMVALERRPLEQMQVEASRLQNKVSLFGQMKSLLSGLQDASNRLLGSSLWTQTKAVSANSAAVSVSTSTGGAVGNFAISVQALAAAQNVVGNMTYADSSELVGAGTMTIEVGSWDDGLTTLTPKSGTSSIDITLDAEDTLATLRDKINAAGAGVSASIVTDANGARLSVRSTTTGVENGFRLGVVDGDGNPTDAAGLSRFAYDPSAGQTQMLRPQAAANAAATVNGIAVSSTTNDLNSVVEGLNIRLLQVTATNVDVGVSIDTGAITEAVNAFAKAYSSLASFIKSQTKYDETSKTGGPLQGDSAAVGVLNQLRSLVGTPSGASTSFSRLSDIGLELTAEGGMTVNTTKLTAALGDLPELRKALSNVDDDDASNHGFAQRFALMATNVLGTDGSLSTRTDSLQTLIKNNGLKQDRLNDRVDRFEERLITQYAAMDVKMSQLTSLSNYLTQQLAMFTNLNK